MTGDLVRLKLGDQVVADGRLTDAEELGIDASILAGEAEPVAVGVGDEVRSGSFAAEVPAPTWWRRSVGGRPSTVYCCLWWWTCSISAASRPGSAAPLGPSATAKDQRAEDVDRGS